MNPTVNHTERLSWKVFLIFSLVYTLFLIHNLEDTRQTQNLTQNTIKSISSAPAVAEFPVPDTTLSSSIIVSLLPCEHSGYNRDDILFRIRISESHDDVSFRTDAEKYLTIKPILLTTRLNPNGIGSRTGEVPPLS